MKMLRAGVNLKIAGKSVREMAGWSLISAKNICSGKPAFHAALPGKQCSFYFCSVLKPCRIEHSSDVQHNDDPVEDRKNRICHGGFFPAEIEIPVKRPARTVPAFAGEAADRDDSGIGECPCLPEQFLRKLRLFREPRRFAVRALTGNILFIERGKRPEELYFPFLLLDLQALEDASDIGSRHIAASAAAFYVIRLCFAEHGNALPLMQRKGMILIFQKDHALRCRVAGQCYMVFTAGYALSVSADPGSRHIPDPLPLGFVDHAKGFSVGYGRAFGWL